MQKNTLFLLTVFVTVPLVAQPASREPWKLSVEERIVRRTSTKLARERIRSDRQLQAASAQVRNREARPIVDSFDGMTHPELFLPHEVFDELLKLAFLGSPRTGQVVRDGFMPEVRRHGLPGDFWQRLEAVSAVYIADSRALRDIGSGVAQQDGKARGRSEQALALRNVEACRSCAEALAAARAAFGPERFDRFLYEVIAVNMHYVADRLPQPELLRKAERGCR